MLLQILDAATLCLLHEAQVLVETPEKRLLTRSFDMGIPLSGFRRRRSRRLMGHSKTAEGPFR
jgi:hypothetical protein